MNIIKEKTIPIEEIKITERDIESYGLKDKFLKEYINKEIDKIEDSFKNVSLEFKDRFEKNEWILMTDNVYYLNSIFSLIPHIDKCRSNNSSSNLELGDLEFEDFLGEIPTADDIKEIFGSQNIHNHRQVNGVINYCDIDYYGVTIEDNKFIVTYNDTGLEWNIFEYSSKDLVDKNLVDKNILILPIYRLNIKDNDEILESLPEDEDIDPIDIDEELEDVEDSEENEEDEIDEDDEQEIEDEISASSVILKWIENSLRPSHFEKDETRISYNILRYLDKKGVKFQEIDGAIVFQDKDSLKEKILNDCISGKKFNFIHDFKTIFSEENYFEFDEFVEKLEKDLLNCDYKRAALSIHKPIQLYESGLGHWDLWDYNDLRKDSKAVVKLKRKMYARNPEDDINKDDCVAIDFGTKSTVVAYKESREGQKVIPVNLGNEKEQYENPTVIFFNDFNKFLEDYRLKDGRPPTKWDNLTVSYQAQDSCDSASGDLFGAFLTDLKSWVDKSWIDDKNKILIDGKQNDFTLKSFKRLQEGDIDPLEYYAYIIGLCINRISGHIYIKYKMSFPVHFSEELCEKICDSFKRGIKKSFPTSLLSNKEIDKKLKVVIGYREPVAYALTALEKYNFTQKIKNRQGDNFYYSVFDFGGGTTDFDFGVYTSIDSVKDEKKKRKYKNRFDRLIHFGGVGIDDLGGEKLLKYLAFKIFTLNKNKLMDISNSSDDDLKTESFDVPKHNAVIQFVEDIEGKRSADIQKNHLSNLVFNDSIYAKRNMYNLVKELRWCWENPDGNNLSYLQKDPNYKIKKDLFDRGTIKVDLIDSNGTFQSQCELSSVEEDNGICQVIKFEEELLRKKIELGIDEFFKSMRLAFSNASKDEKFDIKDLKDVDEIAIFLAGNSTRSTLFNKILREYLGVDDQKKNSNDSSSDADFSSYSSCSTDKNCKAKKLLGLDENSKLKLVVYPPLGTPEAKTKQEGCGYEFIDGEIEPTGKTGVAYGLLCDKMLVEVANDSGSKKGEFQFFVGINESGEFKTLLSRGAEFGKWVEFDEIFDDSEDYYEFDFLYTTKSEAGFENMEARLASRPTVTIEDPEEEQKIYIRPIDQNKIEYRVVDDESELEQNPDIVAENVIVLE